MSPGIKAILREAMIRLDMAFCSSDDERLSKRFAETRDKIVQTLEHGDDAGFTTICHPSPRAFVQWKGTDVCMDFHCECGAHCHFDGRFAYAVQCPHCNTIYEMPFNLFPRRADQRTPEYWRKHPQLLERDEDVERG